ncbi:MAG: S-layer homology domain-containing protein [Oscillospiraceae bacterium]
MKRTTAFLLVLALLSSLLTVSAAAGYSDVPDGHWACSDIEKAGQYGLMQGYGDGRFGLEDSLNRASFVAILCRMFSWEAVTSESPSYIDVQPGDWYYTDVETALAHGALERTVSFRPKDPISREEMAVMLVRALGYEQLAEADYNFDLPFADVTENKGYITLAWQIGLTNGIEKDGKLLFQPNASATREQAAAMLVRVYERYTSNIEWLHAFYAFKSYDQIGLTDSMDAVSLGWARLETDGDGNPWVNTTSQNNNDWTIPSQPEAALNHFESNGTPYNLNIYSDDAAILATEESRSAAIQAVAALADGYAGITMDFEGLCARSKDQFTAFMTALRAALPADKALYVCVTPVVPDDSYFDGYDYRALGEVCDKVILMAHDYQYTSVPSGYIGTKLTNSYLTPFNKIYYALAAITDPDTGVADRSKIALAISFGSVGWRVDEEDRLLQQSSFNPGPSTIILRLRQEDTAMGWSEIARNPYIYYTTEDGSRYRLWYEDSRSVLDKIELARMFGITGVSLWRLGTVPDYSDEGLYYDVWDSLLELR